MTVRRVVVACGVCLACCARTPQALAQTTAVPHESPTWLDANRHRDGKAADAAKGDQRPTPSVTSADGAASPTSQATGTAAQTPGPSTDRFAGARRWFSRLNGTRDGFTPRIGTITSGSGLSFGGTFQQPILNGAAHVTTDAMFSVRGYRVLELGAFAAPFEKRPLMFGARVRHEGYPQEDFYGIGQASARDHHTSYMREGLDMSAFVTVAPRPWLSIEGSAGFLDMKVRSGSDKSLPSIVDRFDAATAPGLGADADMVHVGISLDVDRRDAGFFPRSGGRYFAGVTAFHGLADFRGDFTRTDVDVRQYFALPKTTKHVIAVRGQFAFTSGAGATDDGAGGMGVPFYMLPRLGGSSTLRAYETSRFTDRHAMAFTIEHRWLVTPTLQIVGFADAGQVARRLGAFDFSSLRMSVGAGVRYNIKNAAVARFDIATGQEGPRFIIGFSPSF